MKYIVMLCALLLPTALLAEITPERGEFDPHIRVVSYNPANVVRLTTFYGVSTHVQFGDSEVIKEVALGDTQAWEIQPRRNHLFIKPKAAKADTNVTVVTDQRVYQFVLVVEPRSVKDDQAWRDPNLVFSLSFRYPQEEAAAQALKAQVDSLRVKTADMKTRLREAKMKTENTDYWVAGSAEVSPTAARDDGQFTYLTFSNNRDMPAIYTLSSEGDEALVNTNVEGNTIVVQRLAQRLVLRKGKFVACVLNRSFDIDSGRDNTSGTVAPDVQRLIKGAN